MAHRVLEGRKVCEMMAKLWKENLISREVKRELHEKAVYQRYFTALKHGH